LGFYPFSMNDIFVCLGFYPFSMDDICLAPGKAPTVFSEV
jgi:hypothetical protein